MTSDRSDRTTPPQEKLRVSINTPQDVEYWTYRLHCTEPELRDAVESVGEEPGRVMEYLHLVRGERDEE